MRFVLRYGKTRYSIIVLTFLVMNLLSIGINGDFKWMDLGHINGLCFVSTCIAHSSI